MTSPEEDELGVGVWTADFSSLSADMVAGSEAEEKSFIPTWGNGNWSR